jgi:hypothetical protein
VYGPNSWLLSGYELDELLEYCILRRRGNETLKAVWAIGRGLLLDPARRELGYGWFGQSLEVGVPDAHGVGVSARPEYYCLVFR